MVRCDWCHHFSTFCFPSRFAGIRGNYCGKTFLMDDTVALTNTLIWEPNRAEERWLRTSHMPWSTENNKKWKISISLSATRSVSIHKPTDSKNCRFKQKNPFAIIVISNLVICSMNSCLVRCNLSLPSLQNVNSSTFLTSFECFNESENKIESFSSSLHRKCHTHLYFTNVTRVQQRHTTHSNCNEIDKWFCPTEDQLKTRNFQHLSLHLRLNLTKFQKS